MEIGRLEKTATLFNICFEIGAHVVYYPSREMRTGIGDNIANICRESALLIAADLVRLDSHLITNIESKLYAYLENLPSYSSLYTNRLDAELAEDQRIIKKINENL